VPKMHQNTSFSRQKSENFLGGGFRPFPHGEGTPLPIPHPLIAPTTTRYRLRHCCISWHTLQICKYDWCVLLICQKKHPQFNFLPISSNKLQHPLPAANGLEVHECPRSDPCSINIAPGMYNVVQPWLRAGENIN